MKLHNGNVWRNRLAYYMVRLDLIAFILFSVFNKWQKAGMNFSQILLLQGIFGLFILLAEFPSGVLADLRSRKELILIGQFMILLGIFGYLVTSSFVGFIVAEFFFALGLASKSGTVNAFAYDTYLEIEQQQEADELISKGQILVLAGYIVSLVFGGYLSTIQNNLPFIIAMCGYLMSSITVLISIEPQRIKSESSRAVMRKAFVYLKNSTVIQVIMMMLFLGVPLRVAFWAYIPSLQASWLTEQWHGMVLAGANLIALGASVWARKHKDSSNIVYILPVGVFGLIIMVSNRFFVLLFAIALHQISRGIINIVSRVYLNRAVESDIRASIASLIGTIVSMSYFVFSTLMDILGLDQYTILVVNMGIGLMFLFSWIAFRLPKTHPQDNPVGLSAD